MPKPIGATFKIHTAEPGKKRACFIFFFFFGGGGGGSPNDNEYDPLIHGVQQVEGITYTA